MADQVADDCSLTAQCAVSVECVADLTEVRHNSSVQFGLSEGAVGRESAPPMGREHSGCE